MPQTRYQAVFTGVTSERSAAYEFETDAELFNSKPHDVLTTALESIETTNFAEHHDYEIHAVSRNSNRDTVVGIGYLVSGKGEVPFTIRVSRP